MSHRAAASAVLRGSSTPMKTISGPCYCPPRTCPGYHALVTTSTERQPSGQRWISQQWPGPSAPNSSAWRAGPILVLSQLVDAEYPDGDGHGLQWIVSISASRKRPKPKQVRRALRAFKMVGSEEDQHHPGIARQYWRPLDPAHRVDCQCKIDELTVVDEDGYAWTTPVGGACGGCELEGATGSPCPLHRPGSRGNQASRARQLDR